MQYRNQVFRFSDVGQVRRSLERISKDNLHEDEKFIEGEFQGILPKRRTYEFKISGTNQVIVGKVAPAIEDVDSINKHLHELVEIRTMITQVGTGRPRYLLLDLPLWNDGM